MLLNMLRMRYPRPKEPTQLVSTKELTGTHVLKLLLRDPFYDQEIPSFLFKAVSQLTDEEKALLRASFYKFFNMTAPALARWSKDKRVKDGASSKRMVVSKSRGRLRELAVLRVIAKQDGTNWNDRFYRVAQECVFVFRNLYHPRRVDYINWALLRNFGLDWERPTDYARRRPLPLRVRRAVEEAIGWRQFAGKPKSRK